MGGEEEKDLSRIIRRRKRAGWLLGSYSLITFLISLPGLVLSALLFIFLFNETLKLIDCSDCALGLVEFLMFFILSFIATIFFASCVLFSIFKFISGIMMYKGKKVGFIIGTLTLWIYALFGLLFSLSLSVLTIPRILPIQTIILAILIVFSLVDISILIYLIYVLISSWESFSNKNRRHVSTI